MEEHRRTEDNLRERRSKGRRKTEEDIGLKGEGKENEENEEKTDGNKLEENLTTEER